MPFLMLVSYRFCCFSPPALFGFYILLVQIPLVSPFVIEPIRRLLCTLFQNILFQYWARQFHKWQSITRDRAAARRSFGRIAFRKRSFLYNRQRPCVLSSVTSNAVPRLGSVCPQPLGLVLTARPASHFFPIACTCACICDGGGCVRCWTDCAGSLGTWTSSKSSWPTTLMVKASGTVSSCNLCDAPVILPPTHRHPAQRPRCPGPGRCS